MPDPQLPYIIQGIIKASSGTVAGTTVTLVNKTKSSNPLTITTNSEGMYLADAANFNTGYDLVDEVEVEAYSLFKDEYKKDSFRIIGTEKTFNLDLEVINALSRSTTGYNTPNVLVNVNQKPFSKSNPLPTEVEDRRYTKVYGLDSNSLPIYEGWAKIGSSKSAAVWRIKKYTRDSNGVVTDEQWADGNDSFDNIWNSRTSYDYS